VKIVGKRTRNPQKISACITPGTSRWSSFRCPSTMVASFRTRARRSELRDTGFPIETRRVRNSARRAKSAAATPIAAASAIADTMLAVELRPPSLV
jgi:hypothetical protein